MRFNYLFTLGVGALVAAMAGTSLFRARTLMERELGVLAPQMDSLAADWDAKKVPIGSRVVTILLSDARAAFDPFLLAPEAELADAGGWVGQNLIGGNSIVPAPTALVRAYADSTQLISWTHNGFEKVGQEAMAREIEKAILKAHDAGAEINIVARGTDAGAVYRAIKRVQGQERGGVKVGANKVVLLGLSPDRLKFTPWTIDMQPPANVNAIAFVWTTRELDGSMRMRVLDGRRDAVETNLDEAWPGQGGGDDSVDKNMALIRLLVESPLSLDEVISQQEALRNGERDAKAALARAAASAEAEKAAQAAALAANNQGRTASVRPVAVAYQAPPPEPVKQGRPGNKGAGPIAARENWPSGRLFDYSKAMNGTPIGWLFSAPEAYVEALPQEHNAVTLKNLPGLGSSQCSRNLSLRAVAARKLGSGDRDAEIHKLYERESGISGQGMIRRVSTQRVHGRPAGVFKHGTPESEKIQFIVETGPHLIYFTLETYFQADHRDACLQDMTLFQGIAESIRPDR